MNELYRYSVNKKSPTLSYKLWQETVFVDFKRRRYLSYCLNKVQDLEFLYDHGFTAVDNAIADTVMRFNCIPGCITGMSCSGHPGRYREAYIRFTEIPVELAEYLDGSGIWIRDDDITNTWRAYGIHNDSTSEWLGALKYLADYPGMPDNGFEYLVESISSVTGEDGIERLEKVIY